MSTTNTCAFNRTYCSIPPMISFFQFFRDSSMNYHGCENSEHMCSKYYLIYWDATLCASDGWAVSCCWGYFSLSNSAQTKEFEEDICPSHRGTTVPQYLFVALWGYRTSQNYKGITNNYRFITRLLKVFWCDERYWSNFFIQNLSGLEP